MALNLLTGHTGTNHVTSAQAGAFNASMFGGGKYMMNTGSKMAYEVISNNLITISDGALINQGRYMNIDYGDTVGLSIENGQQGMKRSDLIVARYTMAADGIEKAELVVIKGVSGDSYVDPAYISGNILTGATQDDFPLYRVNIDGLVIESVDTLYSVNVSMNEVFQSVSDGKSAIASAITDKGVPTDSNVTFAVMSDNITAIQSGGDSIGYLVSDPTVTEPIVLENYVVIYSESLPVETLYDPIPINEE